MFEKRDKILAALESKLYENRTKFHYIPMQERIVLGSIEISIDIYIYIKRYMELIVEDQKEYDNNQSERDGR